MSLGLVVGIALLLLTNAFFVGAEFAVITARRSSIEPRAHAGSRAARIARRSRRFSQADSVNNSRAAASAISRFVSAVTRALTTSVQLMGHNVSQR